MCLLPTRPGELQALPTLCRLPRSLEKEIDQMRNEFTSVLERDGDWYIAYSPEMPGANGQGRTEADALDSLREAIALILEDRRVDGLRGVPETAIRGKVTVE
jgi:predicted RNase H-like HicB family nuclease